MYGVILMALSADTRLHFTTIFNFIIFNFISSKNKMKLLKHMIEEAEKDFRLIGQKTSKKAEESFHREFS